MRTTTTDAQAGRSSPPAEPDRSIGESIERLLDEAVAYGRAEFELLKARALESVESYRRAAVLLAAAAVVGLAGVVALFVGIAAALGALDRPPRRIGRRACAGGRRRRAAGLARPARPGA